LCFDLKRARRRKYLALIATIHKVNDVACVNPKGDISHGERAIADIEVPGDRESAVKECRVWISNRDVDGVRVTTAEGPSDVVRGTLDPVGTGTRPINGDRQCGGGEPEESKSAEEHYRFLS